MQVKMTGSKVASLELTISHFSDTLKKKLKEANNQATKLWLKTVLKDIPTYTGTARGTFKPLGRALRATVNKTSVVGNRERARKKKWIHVKGRKYRAGFEFGETYGDYSIFWSETSNKMTCGFTFTSDLPYVLWNDAYPAPVEFHLLSNPPWQAFRKAAKAWYKYVKEEIPKRLPKSKNLHKIHIVRVR